MMKSFVVYFEFQTSYGSECSDVVNVRWKCLSQLHRQFPWECQNKSWKSVYIPRSCEPKIKWVIFIATLCIRVRIYTCPRVNYKFHRNWYNCRLRMNGGRSRGFLTPMNDSCQCSQRHFSPAGINLYRFLELSLTRPITGMSGDSFNSVEHVPLSAIGSVGQSAEPTDRNGP